MVKTKSLRQYTAEDTSTYVGYKFFSGEEPFVTPILLNASGKGVKESQLNKDGVVKLPWNISSEAHVVERDKISTNRRKAGAVKTNLLVASAEDAKISTGKTKSSDVAWNKFQKVADRHDEESDEETDGGAELMRGNEIYSVKRRKKTKPQKKCDPEDIDGQAAEENNEGGEGRCVAEMPTVQEQMQEPALGYFHRQDEGNGRTSDRTLEELNIISPKALQKEYMNVNNKKDPKVIALVESYKKEFTRWQFLVDSGFNLLMYGFGSKKALIQQFVSETFVGPEKAGPVVMINGFHPTINIKHVLNLITNDILGHSGTFRSPLQQVQFIRERLDGEDASGCERRTSSGRVDAPAVSLKELLSSGEPKKRKKPERTRIYLVIHNIEGPALRSSATQTVLSALASINGIHTIASIDHIGAPLVWDHSSFCRGRFVWIDSTTFLHYTQETVCEEAVIGGQGGGRSSRGVWYVLRSLTPNARAVFKLLAQYQLTNVDEPGLPFSELFQRTREKFIVTLESTLTAMINEFKDHKLIKSRREGKLENLYIPFEEPLLRQVFDGIAEEA